MGGALLLSQNLQRVLTLWGDDIQLTVYLSEDITTENQANLEKFLKSNSEVGEVRLVTQERALTDFRTQLASYAPDLAKDDELLKLIPASLQVSLAHSVAAQEQGAILQNLAAKVKELPGVDDVSYGQEWVEKYSALVTAIEVVIRFLGFIVIMASVFVMSNMIRASVEGRREEIAVLELIGATARMIRRPFIVEGALLGGTASLLAVVLCYGIFFAVKQFTITKLSFLQLGEHLAFLNVFLMIGFVIFGVVLGAVGSFLCVRRVNDGWAARAGT
jgi:cell division transport system permease protein